MGTAALRIDILADGRNARQEFEKTSGGMSKIGKVGAVAAAGVALAATAVVKVGSALVTAGETAATSNARIESVIGSMGQFGGQADEVSSRLIKLAESTALQTGIDQNSIKATQAKLLTFKELAATAGEAGGAFDRANQAALDLAAAGFGEAESNAVQLGKALNDPITGMGALAENGITFTAQEKERVKALVESNRTGEAQAMILKAIETQVGGTAKATAKSSDRMKVGFSQVKERLGGALLPMFEKVATWVMDKMLPAVQRFAEQLARDLGPTIKAVGGFIGGTLIPAVKSLVGWVMEKIVPAVRSALTPILKGLGAAFLVVKGAIDRNRPALESIFGVLKTVAEFVAEKVAPIIGKVLGFAFKTLGGFISGVLDTIGFFVDGIKAAIQWVKDLIQWVSDSALGKGISAVAGLFSSAPSASAVQAARRGAPGGLAASAGAAATGAAAAVTVGGSIISVRIGERELEAIVDERVDRRDAQLGRRLVSGVRR